MENKEKICFNITPPLGVPLLDCYLSTVDYLVSELRKYTEVEIIDTYGMLESFNESKRIIGYSVETDCQLLRRFTNMITHDYKKMLKYCPDLTFEKFITDNVWMPETMQRYCINNYVEDFE